jgi:hypothetical protein
MDPEDEAGCSRDSYRGIVSSATCFACADGLLFPNTEGNPNIRIDRIFEEIGKAAGIVPPSNDRACWVHRWRDTAATRSNRELYSGSRMCETENFSVDETWLPQQPLATEPKIPLELSEKLAAREKEMIEAALRESAGRVFGPSGAATKLGIARSTLESKIRSLKISKNSFKDFTETIPRRSCLESVQ